MNRENVILQSVVVSVPVNRGATSRNRRAQSQQSEGERLLTFLKSLDGLDGLSILVANRLHTLACSLTSAVNAREVVAESDGGFAGRITFSPTTRRSGAPMSGSSLQCDLNTDKAC